LLKLALRFAAGFSIAFVLLFAWANVWTALASNLSPFGRGEGPRVGIETETNLPASGLPKAISKEGQADAGIDAPDVRGEDPLLAIEAGRGHWPKPKADNPNHGNP
jgi:hypothetical protein